jgi:hypothetical protein
LVFGSTVSDLAPFSGFAGSLRVNLGGFGTLLGVGSTGLAVWGGDGSPDPSLIALWQIVAPSAAPEPGTLAMLSLGLLGLGFTARRRLH